MGIVKFSDKYSESEVLFKNDRSTIHKGIRLDDGSPVLIKSPTENYPSRTKMESFKREFEIGSSLESDYFPKYLEFLEVETSCKVVINYEGSSVLSQLLPLGQSSIKLGIKIAVELAKAIEDIHSKGIIHRDIKPDNILIGIENNELKFLRLFDFSLSTRNDKEYLEFKPTQQIQGSFHYLSPEQTGRMNRIVDYRTDFYSYGATLFEIFSGRTLFPYTEAIELVHAHLAISPDYDSLSQKKIPDILIQLIKKLTAKNPEDRYQSARGIKLDLELILNNLIEGSLNQDFPLGRHDTPEKIQLSNKIYGRDREVFSIFQVFEKVYNTETSEVITVSGVSGVGKTSLVMEAYKPITQRNGIYVSGKYENLNLKRPYSAIIRAIRDILNTYLLGDEETLKLIKKRLKEEFTAYSSMLRDSIPELSQFISIPKNNETLGPEESKNKLKTALLKLMQCLTIPNRPILMFLDDLQWADDGSIEIIDKILLKKEVKNLLLILSYRSNELEDKHPFKLLIDSRGSNWNYIHLEPIRNNYIIDFLIDTFQEESEDVEELAAIVASKTGCNPFYVHQFTENIIRKKLILPSISTDKKWDFNFYEIQNLKNSDSLLDILIYKIQLLSKPSIELLKVASLISGKIGLLLLSEISNLENDKVKSLLDEAVELDLVLYHSNHEEEYYTFTHDKILHAIQSSVDNQLKASIHKKIGEVYYRYFSINNNYKMLFYAVDHFNLSISDDQQEMDFLIELILFNHLAATNSKYFGAYKAALSYIYQAIQYSKDYNLKPTDELWNDILLNYAEITYLNSQLGDALDILLSLDKESMSDKQYIIFGTIITRIYSKQNNLELSVNNSLSIYRKFGISIPRSKIGVITKMLLNLFYIKWKFSKIKLDGILNYKVFEDEKYNLIFDLQADTGPSTYSYNQNIFVLTVLESLKITFKYGLMKNSIINLSGMGMIFGEVFKDKQLAIDINHVAIQIADRLKSPIHKWKTIYVLNTFLYHWKKPLREDIHSFERIIKGCQESGDMLYAGFSSAMDTYKKLNVGYALSLLINDLDYYMNFLKANEDDYTIDFIQSTNISARILGDENFPRKKSISNEDFDEDEFENLVLAKKNYSAVACLHIDRLKVCYFLEEFDEALKYFENFLTLEKFLSGHIKLVDVYYYAFLSISRKFANIIEIPRNQKKLLKYCLKKITNFWKDFPEGFEGKKYLMEAEYLRLRGNSRKAWDYYEKSILGSQSQGLIQEVGNSHLVYSFFLKSMNHGTSSVAHLREARKAFLAWEAYRIVKLLEEKYAIEVKRYFNSTLSTSSSHGSRVMDLDYQSILKSVNAITLEKNQNSLISKLLKLILENTGGTTAVYILASGEIFQSESFDDILCDNDYPRTIFRYVLNSKKPLLIGNVKEESRFAMDEYFDSHRASSILCYPILIGGVLKAVLYMENSKLTHAFTVDKQEVLSILLSQAAISLQNVEITSNLEKQVQARTKDLDTTLKNIRKDIDVAKKIQMGVLPSQLKFPLPIEIEFYPQSDVGGDLYDITELSKNSYRFLIIDATGHGVQGALITMAVKNEYDNIKFTDSPSELLQVLNKKFTNKFKSINALFSAVVVDIDLDKNEIIYSSGGHPDQYLIQDSKIISLEKTGRIIGLSDNSEYKQLTFSFQKGDRLYLFSDGIYERFNSDKEEFGEERFMDLLLEKNSIELNRLYSVIDAKINQFVDGLPPDDDITFIAVEF